MSDVLVGVVAVAIVGGIVLMLLWLIWLAIKYGWHLAQTNRTKGIILWLSGDLVIAILLGQWVGYLQHAGLVWIPIGLAVVYGLMLYLAWRIENRSHPPTVVAPAPPQPTPPPAPKPPPPRLELRKLTLIAESGINRKKVRRETRSILVTDTRIWPAAIFAINCPPIEGRRVQATFQIRSPAGVVSSSQSFETTLQHGDNLLYTKRSLAIAGQNRPVGKWRLTLELAGVELSTTQFSLASITKIGELADKEGALKPGAEKRVIQVLTLDDLLNQ